MIQWGVKFCTAAEIELKKEELEKGIKKLESDVADAKLLINRTEQIEKDIEDVQMEDFYSAHPTQLAERKFQID